jgi:hypothetical protein
MTAHVVPAPTVLEQAQTIMRTSHSRDNERDGKRIIAMLTLGGAVSGTPQKVPLSAFM